MEPTDIMADFTDANVDSTMLEKMLEDFLEQLPSRILSLGRKILLCIIIFLIGRKLIKIIQKMLVNSMQRAGVEEGVISFMTSFINASLYFFLIFFLLSSFGVDTASIIAVVGSAGVAIGLAVQGSLSNLAGGVLILLTRPFKVGDYIIEGNHGKEGTVTDIQIFYTKLTTVHNEVVILPNGELANSDLINVSGNESRKADIKVSISYRADLKKAKQVLEDMMEQDEAVLKEEDHFVFVDDLADSGVVLNIRCSFKQEDYWRGKWRLTEQAKLLLDENGIEIPFPQLDVHMIPEEKRTSP